MSKLPITGEYPPDWPEINLRACESVGHRCIRCGHPYRKGEHGKGEWSQCDEKCTHAGPISFLYADGRVQDITPDMMPRGTPLTAHNVVRLEAGRTTHSPANARVIAARWRILTVHHLDGNKANCSWWNLLPLCQRCHLTVQGNVKPEVPYFLEHSPWFRPYVAGFYAKKYEGKEITREEAVARMDVLLAYERLA